MDNFGHIHASNRRVDTPMQSTAEVVAVGPEHLSAVYWNADAARLSKEGRSSEWSDHVRSSDHRGTILIQCVGRVLAALLGLRVLRVQFACSNTHHFICRAGLSIVHRCFMGTGASDGGHEHLTPAVGRYPPQPRLAASFWWCCCWCGSWAWPLCSIVPYGVLGLVLALGIVP